MKKKKTFTNTKTISVINEVKIVYTCSLHSL